MPRKLTKLMCARAGSSDQSTALESERSATPSRICVRPIAAPGAAIGLTQILLGVADLSLSSAVLWSLLPARAHISFVSFLGIYAAAVIAGVVSHVPGGVGVFEAVMLLALPGIPPDALLGSLLAYRGVYYLVPLLFATLLFGAKELAG